MSKIEVSDYLNGIKDPLIDMINRQFPNSKNIKFGHNITVKDNYTIVSALWDKPFYDTDKYVYIYNSDDGSITELAAEEDSYDNVEITTTSKTVSQSSYFGQSIATDGNIILIGAPGWVNADGDSVGKVYVYNMAGEYQSYILPDEDDDDTTISNDMMFGYSVAIVDDRIFVGSSRAKDDKKTYGALFLFDTDGNQIDVLYSPDQTRGKLRAFGYKMYYNGDTLTACEYYEGKVYKITIDDGSMGGDETLEYELITEEVDGEDVPVRAYLYYDYSMSGTSTTTDMYIGHVDDDNDTKTGIISRITNDNINIDKLIVDNYIVSPAI